MTTPTFNETHFLAEVKRLNELCPARVSEQNAKDFIDHILRRCDYNKEEMFHYFKSIMEEYFPEIKNRTFDVEGWKKIYNFYIKQQELYKFGELLKIGLSMAETEEHFEYGFTTAAKVAGYDGKLLLREIRLDSIGWRKIVDTLVQVAENKGVVVPALPVAENEDEKIVVDTETKVSCDDEIIGEVSTETETTPPVSGYEYETDIQESEDDDYPFPFLESIFYGEPEPHKDVLEVNILEPMDLSGNVINRIMVLGGVKPLKDGQTISQWDRVVSVYGIIPCITKSSNTRIAV